MNRLSFDDLKEIELNLLKELDRICKKHGFTYVLAYGTCLGAVRHGGFIPWDDDIDVYMPRVDYERFAERFASENSPYELKSYRDGKSPNIFIKLSDPKTIVYESFLGKRFPEGVWIDIFPLDRVDPMSPAFERARRKRRFLNLVRGFSVTDQNTGANSIVRIVKRIVCPLARHLDYTKICRTIDELAINIPVTTKADCSLPEFKGYFTALCEDVVEGSLLFPTKSIRFESGEFEGPACPEQYLESIYGNWRKLPPAEQQVRHTVEAYWK